MRTGACPYACLGFLGGYSAGLDHGGDSDRLPHRDTDENGNVEHSNRADDVWLDSQAAIDGLRCYESTDRKQKRTPDRAILQAILEERTKRRFLTTELHNVKAHGDAAASKEAFGNFLADLTAKYVADRAPKQMRSST